MTTKKAPSSVAAKKPAAPAVSPVPAAPAGLHIIAMQIENIKNVSFMRLRPKGNVVTISGAEGAGKSTTIDSIFYALCGESTIPTQPIQKGKNSARIQVDIGDYKVTRTFIRQDGRADGKTYISELKVESKDAVMKSPQSVLNETIGKISFDPLAFIRMKPAQQFETLRSMVVFDVDLAAIDKEKQEAYDKRRDVGRDLDQADARVAGMPAAEVDLPAAAIDTAALTEKLQNAAQENGKAEEARIQKQRHFDNVKALRNQAIDHEENIAKLKCRIEELEKSSHTARAAAAEIEKKAQALTVPAMIDTAAVADELRQAQTTNEKIRQREARKAAEDQAAVYREQWNGLDATVKAKERERAEALARAKMPLPGLEVGVGEVLYEGLPFDQASHSAQIRVSVALGMASNPKLRTMCIQDGTVLQQKSMDLIEEMCGGQNYQLIIERVVGDGRATVVMTDGEASGEDVEVVK